MNNVIIIKPSKNHNKKYDAKLPSGQVISFGASKYQDYTMHKDPQRKKNYLSRHIHDPISI
jgi:hypothetical protein